MFSIGYDIGSSSIKAALIDQKDGRVVAKTQCPEKEMPITSLKIGWGEQDPEMWWENVCKATQKLLQLSKINANEIKSIGISYQMHGLVLVDKDLNVLRPSIIWCDSRAVETGNGLFFKNKERSIDTLLNSPGNFTLSKLKWVKDNEPEIYKKIYKYMLPGDYIAMKLSGDCVTTPSGLSEGITWDFKSDAPAYWLLESAGIDSELIPEIKPTFSEQGTVNSEGAKASGLPEGIPISYRAGDQPNNAMSLNVFNPGEIAATGGTSGVVYAISDKGSTQESTRINSFAHVNHTAKAPRIGKLLNINGAGIQYSWIRNQLTDGMPYGKMNGFAENVPIGSEGLKILPFGNGAERMLGNKSNGAQVSNLNFNIHRKGHMYRAALEGIAFSMVYGMEILANDNVKVASIKAGGDNLFRSEIFSSTISTLTNSDINIVETTGAVGAARASAYALGVFKTFDEAVATDEIKQTYTPQQNKQAYEEAYGVWKEELTRYINRFN